MYTGQMQESMARFKQGGRAEYGKVYGRLLWDAKREWLQRIREPVLVPVPVHSKRYRKRGYNQAEEIAKEMARLSGLPMRSDLLVRVKHTAPQKELSKRERSRNLQGAFRCRADYRKLCLQGQCAIIIEVRGTLSGCERIHSRESGGRHGNGSRRYRSTGTAVEKMGS